MTLGAAIGSYTNDLQEQHYSAGEIGRKRILLRRWLSYAVALHHPGLPSRLLKMTQIRLYSRGVVGVARTTERQVAVAEVFAVVADGRGEREARGPGDGGGPISAGTACRLRR